MGASVQGLRLDRQDSLCEAHSLKLWGPICLFCWLFQVSQGSAPFCCALALAPARGTHKAWAGFPWELSQTTVPDCAQCPLQRPGRVCCWVPRAAVCTLQLPWSRHRPHRPRGGLDSGLFLPDLGPFFLRFKGPFSG